MREAHDGEPLVGSRLAVAVQQLADAVDDGQPIDANTRVRSAVLEPGERVLQDEQRRLREPGLPQLVVPGGESTTIMRLAALYGLDEAVRAFGGPIFYGHFHEGFHEKADHPGNVAVLHDEQLALGRTELAVQPRDHAR